MAPGNGPVGPLGMGPGRKWPCRDAKSLKEGRGQRAVFRFEAWHHDKATKPRRKCHDSCPTGEILVMGLFCSGLKASRLCGSATLFLSLSLVPDYDASGRVTFVASDTSTIRTATTNGRRAGLREGEKQTKLACCLLVSVATTDGAERRRRRRRQEKV